MKKLFFLILSLSLFSCAQKNKYTTINGFAQGTTYSITYADSECRNLQDTIDKFLLAFDRSLSIYDSTSLILKLNNNQTVKTDRWFDRNLELYKEIHAQSDGFLDPTLRPLIAMYGFGGKTGSAPRTASDEQIDSIMVFVGLDKVKVVDGELVKEDPRIELDFNALAQGYSVDLVAEMFDGMGIKNYMIEIGGEIFTRGVVRHAETGQDLAWKIGIDAPFEGNNTPGEHLQAIVELSGRGLATSGNYRKSSIDQNGARLTHTIDPRTGKPASHNLLSVTILAPSAALADGYATACMVGGLEWSKNLLSRHPELDGFFVYASPKGEFLTYSTIDIIKPK